MRCSKTIRFGLPLFLLFAAVIWKSGSSKEARVDLHSSLRDRSTRASRSAASPRTADVSATIGSSLAGAVRDESGIVPPHAQVCLARVDARATPTCIEAPTGTFQFTDLKPGPYQLWATAPGCIPTSYRGARHVPIVGLFAAAIQLLSGERLGGLDLVLQAGGVVLQGWVRDSGSPVVGAQVRWLRREQFLDPQAQTFTGTDGRFTLTVQKGSAVLEASADGYITRYADVAAPGPNVSIELSPGARVSGRVLDRISRQPVGNVTVYASPASPGAAAVRRTFVSPVVSAKDGSFEFTGLSAGTFVLDARGSGWFGESARLQFSVRQPTEVELLVDAGAVVSGQVVGRSSGTTCADGIAGIQLAPGAHRVPIHDGTFMFPFVPPGRHRLDIHCPSLAPQKEPLEIEVGTTDITDIKVQLEDGFKVRGIVVADTNSPVPGVSVEATTTSSGTVAAEFDRRALTQADGTFELTGLLPGQYDVVANDPEGEELCDPVQLAVSSDTSGIHLSLRPMGQLSVRLKGTDGATVTDARVLLVAENFGFRETTFDGQVFRAKNLPPDKYTTRVLGPRGEVLIDESSSPAVMVSPHQPVEVERVVNQFHGQLEGLIVDAEGQPVPDAVVEALFGDGSAEGSGSGQGFVTTGEEGRFQMDGLSSGPYLVRAIDGDGRIGQLAGLTIPSAKPVVVAISMERPRRPTPRRQQSKPEPESTMDESEEPPSP